ncbi:MAG: hypothetical protein MK066_14600 [Crocinitomicaceae bacterium]|nr:hypothetical protein [Crocinitomicaceae bacterium]
MREFFKGLILMISSLIVFSFVIVIGLIYTAFEIPIRCFISGSVKPLYQIPWRTIDGILATLGNTMSDIAIRYDELANIHSEWIEDLSTPIDSTMFGKKNITISAALGKIEYHQPDRLLKRAKKLIVVLNFVFNQTSHAKGSWLKWREEQRIIKLNLHGNK